MSIKEVLHGALLKGPLVTPTGGANAWAGITQIASGSTSVQISSTVIKFIEIKNSRISDILLSRIFKKEDKLSLVCREFIVKAI